MINLLGWRWRRGWGDRIGKLNRIMEASQQVHQIILMLLLQTLNQGNELGHIGGGSRKEFANRCLGFLVRHRHTVVIQDLKLNGT